MEQLVDMFGTRSEQGAIGVTGAALLGVGDAGTAFRDFVLSMGSELQPQDAIEAMLATQIALAHLGFASASGKQWDAKSDQEREAYGRIAERMSQAMINQIEALRRHRSGDPSKIHVSQVTVQAGGQAIVGSVQTRAQRNGE